VRHAFNLSYAGCVGGRPDSRPACTKKWETLPEKIIKARRAEVMAKVAKCLSTRPDVLNSNSSNTKRK
jgi:hypothetical protein